MGESPAVGVKNAVSSVGDDDAEAGRRAGGSESALGAIKLILANNQDS